MAGPSSVRVFGLRVGPGSELLSSLQDFVDQNRLRAPFIVTCVGSVTSARLRLAHATADNTNQVLELSGHFEIVSLVGTLNPEAHLHLSLSDSRGHTVGGHVLGNLKVFTTAEVVIGEAQDLSFTREMDPQTGFPELVVQPRSSEETKDQTKD
ncbi:bifunctional protein GlmU-like [Boleophthalmus pectinirostris]|uniref:bifunctional protein GlmU-like n=1 Tax=Boleophthalmus pectinirostris TaxID=150288 RepID=UPI000A1C6332|nr:bifunctional protein GlmU-like [Boleophthalmus pectinirostris]